VRVNTDGGWQVPFYRVSTGNSCEKRTQSRANAASFFFFFRKTFNAIYGVSDKKKKEI